MITRWTGNLAAKFVLGAVLLTLVPMLVVGVIGFSLGKQGVYTHTSLHLESVATLKSEEVARWVELQRAGLARNLYPGGSAETVDRLLGTEQDTQIRGDSLRVMGEDALDVWNDISGLRGIVLVNSRRDVQYASDPELPRDGERIQDVYAKGSQGVHMDVVWSDSDDADGPFVVIAEPTSGKVEGVVAAYFEPTVLQGMLMPDPGLGAGGRIFLLGPENGVISGGGPELDRPAGDAAVLGGDGLGSSRSFTNAQGVEMVGYVAAVEGLPWTVMAALPTSEAFADVRKMEILILLAMAGVGALGALVAWRFSTTITRPLKQAVVGARAIGEGDLDYRIPVSSGDEVGELSTSFNRMAKHLTLARADLVRAERELASHETSERILQATPISLFVCDAEMCLVTGNDLFYHTFAVEKETSRGQFLPDLMELGPLKTTLLEVDASAAYRGQLTLKDGSGAKRHFSVSATRMAANDDESSHILVALEDITDRVAAEWRYRYLMENANDAMFIIDTATGLIVETNSRACEMLGATSSADIVGRRIDSVHPASMRDVADRRFRETMEQGSNVFDDLPLARLGGGLMEAQISATVVDLGDQRLVFAAVRDISAQKSTEKALRESEERYRHLVEQSPEAVLVHSQGKIVYANGAMASLFGTAHPEDLRDRSIWDFVLDEDRELIEDRMNSSIYEKQEPAPPIEMRVVDLRGRVREVDLTSGPITYQGVQAAQTIMRDITERKQTEERLREAGRLASIGELAAGVAHEINNPLTSI